MMFLAMAATVAAVAQTLNVEMGSVTYQIPAAQAGEMVYSDGTSVTILGKTFDLSEVTRMYVDRTEVTDSTVIVTYSGKTASVKIAGSIAKNVDAAVEGAHVAVTQSGNIATEITYTLLGSSDDGEFYMAGTYKATIALRGLTLTNPSGAAINIQDGKRINLSVKDGTVNTVTDGAEGSQKAAIYCKGHLELKGKGTLNVYGKTAHAIKSAEYMQMKNCTVNVLEAVKDGISSDEYFLMESGTLTVKGVGDDCIQVDLDGTTSTGETDDHEDEDSGNVYLLGGTINLTVTADAAKGVKTAGDFNMVDGSLTVTQTGGIVVDADDISYPTSVKTDGNINITGGTVNITNTASGGKGLSAEGTLNISEHDNVTANVTVVANGSGGTAETSSTGSDSETAKSYKVYVSLPTSGGGGGGGGGGMGQGNAWSSVYLYKSDGTLVQKLTSTVSKSSGYFTTTFYYYDFGESTSGSYYFQSDTYNSRGVNYNIKSATFSAPTSGSDVYYSITNSFSTSGSTRTYSLSNVTNTYAGTSDVSEDEGTGFNAIGLKADGDMTISGGTVTVKNSGAMSKSIKSKTQVTIDGGTVTLTPSGEMKVINNDASYSSGVKTKSFVQNGGVLTINASGSAGRGISATTITTNGGTLKITNTGAGEVGSSDNYTAKGLKADSNIALNAGTITITMSGTGGKGIKCNGAYTQGKSDGTGPALQVKTTGNSLGSSSSGGGWGGGFGPGGQSSGGSSAKAIKVMGQATLYGGSTEINTATDGAEGLESKTAVYIEGGQHYLKCYDDCINSSGNIYFNGGVTVCYSNGNDAVDSNAGRSGAITIGDGTIFAYTSAGSPEEGLDCDNNSYIQITGTGIAISAGGSQGGGGGWGGSSSSTISNAKQGYAFVTSSVSYSTGRYYTLQDSSNKNYVTFSFESSVSNNLSLFTAKGMVKGTTYYVKYNTSAPTDAQTAFHGLYLGSSAVGTTQAISFTAQ